MRFAVRFLGCKVSLADAALIRDALIDAGHVEAPREEAEVQVINTCALTQEAERKSRQQVNRASRAGRAFVTGCAANLNAHQFDGAEAVQGSADRAAAEIVERLGTGPQHACANDAQRPAFGRTRAFLKVQNGCDAACAFCIIPTTRGRAESRPMACILADARRRLAEGQPEVVLTGINIGTYRDPASGADLADLVRALGRADGLARMRISSIEPGSLTDGLLEALAASEVAGPHLHVPLQSGDPGVLARMRRGYSAGDYLHACARARAALPALNVTTDVIVGFPGEDDAAFANTMAVVEDAGISKVHVFPYSPRPGTAAAEHRGAIDDDVRAERAARLRDLSDRRGFLHRRGRVGTDDRVLVERVHEDGTCSGLGADYTRFVVPGAVARAGDLLEVHATGIAGDHVVGEVRP